MKTPVTSVFCRLFPEVLTLAVVAVCLASSGEARAYSITGVTLNPANPIPVGSNIVMTVSIVTPGTPAWLYQATDVTRQGNQIGIDLYPASGLLTAIGRLSTNVTIGTLPVGNYQYEVRLHPREPVNGGVRTNRGSFFVAPNYPWTMVTITAPDPQATESGVTTVIDFGRFTIHRAGETNIDLPVYYTVGGTASNGVDYRAISNKVVIPAGRTAVDIVIDPSFDTLSEGRETVVLRLVEPLCAAIYPPLPECYFIGTPREAVVFIDDNNLGNRLPVVNFFSPPNESSFTAPVNLQLVAYANDPEDRYDIAVEFFSGTNSLGLGKFIPSLCPSPYCPNFALVWSNVPPGNYVLSARATDKQGGATTSTNVHVQVVTNTRPVVTIVARDPVATEGTNCYRWPGWPTPSPTNSFSGTNTATFVVRREGRTNDTITVFYTVGGTATNGVDYKSLPGNIVIPAGQRVASIVIVPADDALPERIETIVLGLMEPPYGSPLPSPYVVGKPARAAAIIVDNDQPRPCTERLADRCFHLTQPGRNGDWFRIEYSDNLVDWIVLCTNTVTDGAIHFVDPEADESSQRFYRVVPEASAITD